jgi:hypothetical protein
LLTAGWPLYSTQSAVSKARKRSRAELKNWSSRGGENQRHHGRYPDRTLLLSVPQQFLQVAAKFLPSGTRRGELGR